MFALELIGLALAAVYAAGVVIDYGAWVACWEDDLSAGYTDEPVDRRWILGEALAWPWNEAVTLYEYLRGDGARYPSGPDGDWLSGNDDEG